jgi:hypothetical protein
MNISGYDAICRSIVINNGCGLAVRGAGKFTLDDNASAGITGAGCLTLIGTQASPISVGPATPTNPWTLSVSNISSTYGYLRGVGVLPIASTVNLTDSELGFYPTTDPAEVVVSGAWTITRTRVWTQNGKKYYIKPTGSVVATGSYFDGILPSIYSSTYYVVFFDNPMTTDPQYTKVEALHLPLGGTGYYSITTGYGGRKIAVTGNLTDRNISSWNHPLAQRWFISKMTEVMNAPDTILSFTWHEGSMLAALTNFGTAFGTGRDWSTGIRRYDAVLEERPYQVRT